MKSRRSLSLVFLIVFAALFAGCESMISTAPPFKKYADGNDVPKISVADAKREFDAGKAVIVDSRSEAVYRMEHITGSINIPQGSPKEKYEILPKNKKVIIYCACNGEGTSISLAYHMNEAGVPNTYAMVDGFLGWKTAGYPMTKAQN